MREERAMRVRVVNERIVKNKTAGRLRGSVGICEFSIVAGGLTTVREIGLLKWVFFCHFISSIDAAILQDVKSMSTGIGCWL